MLAAKWSVRQTVRPLNHWRLQQDTDNESAIRNQKIMTLIMTLTSLITAHFRVLLPSQFTLLLSNELLETSPRQHSFLKLWVPPYVRFSYRDNMFQVPAQRSSPHQMSIICKGVWKQLLCGSRESDAAASICRSADACEHSAHIITQGAFACLHEGPVHAEHWAAIHSVRCWSSPSDAGLLQPTFIPDPAIGWRRICVILRMKNLSQ